MERKNLVVDIRKSKIMRRQEKEHKDKVELEEGRNRRNEEFQVSRIHAVKEWTTGGT